jgi:hypothetical protein
MRILLATAVAIAPLMAASGAMAQVVITTTRTTPISTSTATGTGPDNIRIGDGGVISLTTGTAVTVDSNNTFTMNGNGTISMSNAANGATAVLVNPGVTTTLQLDSSISVTDSIDTYPDSDNDGDIDGPWATGSDRYGVRLAGGTPVTGNITIAPSTGSILVEGNQSYALSIESGLIGNVQSQGSIRVFGDNSIAFRTTGDVTGNVALLGQVLARGQGSSAVSIGADISGRLTLQGSLSATGYRYTARGTDEFMAKLEAEDKLQGGPTVIVAGNVAGGVVVDGPPTTSTTNPDVDGDGILDVNEGTAQIDSYGSSAAIQVGSATESITLGAIGTGDDAYGFINRGTISGQGVYDLIDANAVVFGGNAGQTVNLVGGMRNQGTISALATKADATAVRFGTGTIAPAILNSGAITAGISSDIAATAVAIQIDQGASVQSLTNNGSILASTGGGVADVIAINDASGTLTSIINQRSIQANISPNEAGDAITGNSTAIDVRANTSGVTLIQRGVAATPTEINPDTDGDGVPDDNEPVILGDVLLGSGGDTVSIENGFVVGLLSFGAGADTLAISGGADVRATIADADGALSVNIANGTLDSRNTTAFDLTTLNIGADGRLLVSLDPTAGTAGTLNVSGNANLATGAELGVRFNSLLASPTRFNLIDAGTLTLGTVDFSTISENSPYLYVVEAGTDQPNGIVFADVRQRTTAEAGMIGSEAGLYDAFYSALGRDEDIRNAFLAQVGRDNFFNLYEQLLPESSGGPLLSLASGVDAVTRALTGRNASAAPGETSAWVQEINFYADKDRTDTYGFRSEGFGVAGGVERGTGLGAVGLSVAFTSSDLEDPESEAEEVLSANLLELGLYWRAQGQYWTTWARAAAGYASFESERRLVGGGLNLRNEADWNGVTLAAAGGASYERNFGRFSVRPEIYAEYFSLSEDGYTETGGGDGFDLDIDDREGHLFSATAAINIGMGMGENSWLRPEVRLGWRQNISVDPGDTVGRFTSGGPDFRLDPATVEGGGPLLGFRLNVGNELGMLSISADAELIEDYVRYMLFLRASFRF